MTLLVADTRSLAALRIGTAACVLLDLLQRSLELGTFYSDAGILPRAALLGSYPDRLGWQVSFALAGGSWWSQALLLGATAVAAVQVLIGYRTRISTCACWLLLTSLYLRNHVVLFGAHALMQNLMFWGMLLPWGGTWSVDRRWRPEGERDDASLAEAIVTTGAMLQVGLIFFIAGLAKYVSPWWIDGVGLSHALDYELIVRPFGQWIGSFPRFCGLVNFYVIGAELAGAFLLLSPLWPDRARLLGIGLLIPALFGFGISLSVGLFPLVASVALLLFLPGWTWDWIESTLRAQLERRPDLRRQLRRTSSRLAKALAPAAVEPVESGDRVAVVRWSQRFRAAMAVAAVIYIGVLQIGLWREAGYQTPGWINWFGETFALRQRWGMFTGDVSTGWFEVPGTLVDGSSVDLFARGGPLPNLTEARQALGRGKPAELSSEIFASINWQSYFIVMAEAPGDQGVFLAYGRYLCRSWNERHSGGEQLKQLEVVLMARPAEGFLRPHPASDYQRRVLWRHWCFQPPAGSS